MRYADMTRDQVQRALESFRRAIQDNMTLRVDKDAAEAEMRRRIKDDLEYTFSRPYVQTTMAGGSVLGFTVYLRSKRNTNTVMFSV